jgi:transcription-repair coupling factor (superfamily II helicase)
VPDFVLNSAYEPTADQPQAIDELVAGAEAGEGFMALLGATGTGKTFTMASTINRLQRPALVIAHNKTLAAQLCNEFREFFPAAAVEYFVSYYDYYQPEAYVPAQDLYIEKDSTINDEIDRLRHAATAALFARRERSPERSACESRSLDRRRWGGVGSLRHRVDGLEPRPLAGWGPRGGAAHGRPDCRLRRKVPLAGICIHQNHGVELTRPRRARGCTARQACSVSHEQPRDVRRTEARCHSDA